MAIRRIIWSGQVISGPSASQLGIATTTRLPFGAREKDQTPIEVFFRLATPIDWRAQELLETMSFTVRGISHHGDYEMWSIHAIPVERVCKVMMHLKPKHFPLMVKTEESKTRWVVEADIQYSTHTKVGTIILFVER